MTVGTVSTILAACSPFLLALFTWITRRGLENRQAEESRVDKQLTQQRDDFIAITEQLNRAVERLEADNTRLAERVDSLDQRLDAAESDNQALVFDFRRTIDHLDRHYQDPGPSRTQRVNEILGLTP